MLRFYHREEERVRECRSDRVVLASGCRPDEWSFPKGGRAGDREEVTDMAKRKKEEFVPEDAQKMTADEIAGYLAPREVLFVKSFLTTLNGTQAAIQAGYKAGKDNASAAVQASRLMKDPRIRAYRDAVLRESVEDMALTRDNVLLRQLEVWRRCMAAEPVMIWDSEKHEWVESGVWRFDAKGATKALENIAKLLGLDAPKQINLNGSGLEGFLSGLEGGRRY